MERYLYIGPGIIAIIIFAYMRNRQADRNDKLRNRFRKREEELMNILSSKKEEKENKEDVN